MTRRSLWADYQEEEPQPGADRARVLWSGHEDEPEVADEAVREPAPPSDIVTQPLRPAAVAFGAIAAIFVVALATTLPGRGTLAVGEVPSYWERIPMRCETARIQQPDRAIELFRCRALAGGRLPPGVYRSPGSQWTSDITRRDARANVIRIGPDGELRGWAIY